MAAPLLTNGAMRMGTISRASLEGSKLRHDKAFISGLCRQFYHSIPKTQQPIILSGSVAGGQKHMHTLSHSGSSLAEPRLYKPSKSSNCKPFFLKRARGGRRNAEVTAQTSSNGIESPIRRCIVLDIEGTTTPISFVTDVLFPYARDNAEKHLELTFDTAKTQDDIELLRAQVKEDLENNVAEAVPIPSDGDREEVIAALVANVKAMIKADRKITSLKQLQGHIWQTGFQNKEIETVVYDDVPEALEKWQALGLKVYIYSSGSRLAQRLLFGNTNYGDLRKFLCGYFDTTIGNKKETKSYIEITETLGVDDPSEILFVTDVYQEATAAKEAGLEVVISVRPGNGPLPEKHDFQTINSFTEI